MITHIKKIFKNLFVPHRGNNYRAQILKHEGLTATLVILIIFNIGFRIALGQNLTNVLGVAFNIAAPDLLNYTNEARKEYGLKELTLNPVLSKAAAEKAQDMFQKNYWAHYSPDGISPWFFFNKNGYRYLYAGENLAKDFNTSRDVVNAWMNSKKHRENILQPAYTEIGFAVKEGMLDNKPTVLIVQFLAQPEPEYLATRQEIKQNIQQQSSVGHISVQKIPEVASKTTIQKKPLLNTQVFSRRMAILVLGLIAFALSIDIYITSRISLKQEHGKSYAHLVFIAMIIVGIIILQPGIIL